MIISTLISTDYFKSSLTESRLNKKKVVLLKKNIMQNLFESRKKRSQFNYKSGDKFGRLTLTGLTYTKSIYGHWVRYVEAVCECGIIGEYAFHSIAKGDTQSCGCLRKLTAKKLMTTHNLSWHPLYDVHQHLIMRCYLPEDPAYKNYGGRGIEVWKDWRGEFGFIEFYEWCMANGYKEGLSLDREENNGHYAPYNCRFIAMAEQCRNRRNNKNYTAFGETKCIWDWGKDYRCKISKWGLIARMKKDKWKDNFELALTTPKENRLDYQRARKNNRMFTAFGETKCMSAWLEDKRCLVKIDSFRDRIAKGWNAEKTMSIQPQASGKKGVIFSK